MKNNAEIFVAELIDELEGGF